MNNILEMKGIRKSFGVPVLKGVDFKLKKGEVTALVGGNGAGKSTLMKIMTGVYKKDDGDIYINGEIVNLKSIHDAKKYGIAMIFQELSLVPSMTVAENIFLGNEISKDHLINKNEMNDKSIELLNMLGIEIDPKEIVGNLSIGLCQMVEIAKALSKDAKILVFDEPTASLSDSEIEQLFIVINKLKANGLSMVYISHRMNEILHISDSVTVLRDGQVVMDKSSKDLSLTEIVYSIMGKGNDGFKWVEREYDDSIELLRVENIKVNSLIDDISFSLKKGEILGFAGLMGSGRTEILETIFGIRKKISGKIYIENQEVSIKNPRDAVKNRLALIPEDRRTQGLVLEHSVKENAILPQVKKILKNKLFVDEKAVNEIVEENIKKLNVVTKGMNKTISLLSGGNQQKVVIAKWMNTNPRVMMLDEPTSGIDIGAKTEIIELMREFADEGNGVIFVSSELSELLSVCDQIYVLKDGSITKKFDRREIKTEETLQYAIQN